MTCTSDCTITLVVSPMRATNDEYVAVTEIFAATLVALCVIWGMKYLYRMFVKPTDA